MTYLGINSSIGKHGGGTHQWNVYYEEVQYGWRVSHATTEAECSTDAWLVHQLWRHDIQPCNVLHQTLDTLIDPESLLFGQARPILLVDAFSDWSKCHLLHALPVHPDLPLLSTEEDLESGRTRPLSKR